MRRHLLTIVAAGLMVAAVGSEEARAGDLRPNDEAVIRELVSAFHEAANRHDAKAVASFFAPDAEFTNVVGMTAIGRRDRGVPQAPIRGGHPSRQPLVQEIRVQGRLGKDTVPKAGCRVR